MNINLFSRLQYFFWQDAICRLQKKNQLTQISFIYHRGNDKVLVSMNWAYTYRQPEVPPDDIGFLTLDIYPNDQVFDASYVACACCGNNSTTFRGNELQTSQYSNVLQGS